MDDSELIRLFCVRDESAIAKTDARYGQTLRRIAYEVLRSREDAEEIVSDVLLTAWNAVPSEQPVSLFGYLAVITRNLAVKRLNARRALRRGGGERPALLDELAECVAAPGSVEEEISGKLLWEHIRAFLSHEPENVRRAFLLRYALALPFDEIAERLQMSAGAVRISLHRTRNKLKQYLKQEGWL